MNEKGKNNQTSSRVPLKKHMKTALLIGTCFVILASLTGIGIKQSTSEKNLADLKTEVNTLQPANNTEQDPYLTENEQLKQELTSAQQDASDWKSYADNLSSQLSVISQYYQQPIVKEVQVDNPVYVNNQWREFASPADLMAWVKDHLVTIWSVGDKAADCVDYATRLQLEAYKDGYLMSVQIINNGMLDGINVSNYTECHMGDLVIVGKEIYFVEPQPKYFRIVFVCNIN